MTLEEAKKQALLEAAKKQALASARSTGAPNEALQFASGFNQTLINTVGVIPDIVSSGLSSGLEKIGIEAGPPVNYTQELTERARNAGFLKAEGTPETAGERAGNIAGAATAFALPVMGVGRATTATKSLFEPILQTFREAPKTFAAIEGASTVAAIVGGEIARQTCPEGVDKNTCAMLGEIAGGMTGPSAIAVGRKAVNAFPTVRIAKNIWKQLPFVGKGAKTGEAAQIVQDFVGGKAHDLVRQADQFEALPGTQFTFPELAGDDNLLLFQRAIEKASPDVAHHLGARRAATNAAIKENIKTFNGAGNRIQALKDFYDLKFTQLKQALDDRITVAVDRVNNNINKLTPELRRSRASKILNDELIDAMKDARKQEAIVWNKADPDEMISLGTSRNVYLDEIGQETDIPAFVRKFFKGKKIKIKSFKDIKEFRTRMNRFREDQIRAGNFSSSHFLGELDDALMDDVGKSAISGEVTNAVRFSRELNNRFTRGPIGKALRFDTRGGRAVQPGEMSEELFPANPIKASQGVEATRLASTPIDELPPSEMISATARRQEIFSATKETIKNRLFKDTGEFDLNAAKRMLEQKGEFIDKFPALKTQIKRAIEDSTQVDVLRKQIDEGLKTVTDARKSALGIALKAGDNPERIIPDILKSPNRKVLLQQAVRDTVSDPDAFAGLQDSYLDQLLNAGTTGRLDDAGQHLLSGRQMAEFHNRFIQDLSSSGLFNHNELGRINTIIKNAVRIDTQLGSTKLADDILKENTRLLDDLIVRVIGTNLTAPLGKTTGSGLVMAQAGSQAARRIAEKLPHQSVIKLLNEAVKEPELFRDLMTEITTPALQQKVAARLHAWMAALGIDMPDIFEDIPAEEKSKNLATEIQ